MIVDAIRGKAAEIDLLVECEYGDPEAFTYAREIAWLFQMAGVTKIRAGANSIMAVGSFGVRVASAPEMDVSAIIDAFSASGINLIMDNNDLSTHLPSNEIAPNLYFFVGPRAPPPFLRPAPPEGESNI